jgi:hypothetical protein
MEQVRDCFVRFHHLNPAGVSYNYRDGFWEKGNSVYRAICTEYNEYRLWAIQNGAFPQTLIEAVCNHILARAPIYEVTGRELLNCGSDGEPLLLDVQIVRELKIERGRIVAK